MTTFYFHDYAGATYNRQHFDMFCEEWGYKVTRRGYGDGCQQSTRDVVTCYVADEETANNCCIHFPHNVTMGYPVQA